MTDLPPLFTWGGGRAPVAILLLFIHILRADIFIGPQIFEKGADGISKGGSLAFWKSSP